MNKLLKKLLKKWLALIYPGIDGDDNDVDPPESDVAPDPDGDDPDLDLELDLPDDPAPRAASRRDDSGERLARLEAEVERRGRMAAEAAARQPAPVDSEFQREEEKLRNPETTELERWQIQSNRTLREAKAEARQARLEAADMIDRTRFESKNSTDPRRAKYAERVEEAIQQERAQGRNASREAVYFYMLGKDIAEGKLKARAKPASKTPDVPRGRSPGVRSDVQGRGRPTSDRDKLRARLENQNI
jgi:hypothetical protein